MRLTRPLYRQIGIGCERLLRQIIFDTTGYEDYESTKWSYSAKTKAGKEKVLSLDGRLELDDIKNEAGELDWKAIGGTWGSATSKLQTWERSDNQLPDPLVKTCEAIRRADSKKGFAMSQYVLKFFDDMFLHFANLRKHLKKGADVNYILGNSSFYGNYVETETIVKEMMLVLGYTNVSSRIIRKRNSKSQLYEYLIAGVC